MKNFNPCSRVSSLTCLLASSTMVFGGMSTVLAAPTESIKPALPAGKVDEGMLASAENMSADELKELMDLYLKKKDQLMAIKVANLLLKKNPDDAAARTVLARAGLPVADEPAAEAAEPPTIKEARKLANTGKPKEAAALYEKAKAERDPTLPFPYAMEMASAYDDADDFAKATELYTALIKDAATSETDRAEATKRIAELKRGAQLDTVDKALDAGNLTEAKAIMAELSPEDQKSPEARIMSAKTAIAGGDSAAGEAALNQILNDKSISAELREEAKQTLAETKVNQLIKEGEGAFDKGNHQLALSLSEQVYTMAPERTDVVQFRAKTLLKNNQADAALKLLEKEPTARDDASKCDHTRLLAAALEQTSSFQRAIECYRSLGENSKLSLLDRDDAFESAETLAAFGSARSSADWRFIDAEEGHWSAIHLGFQSGILSHALQFIGEGFWDAISPSAGARFSNKTEDDLVEGSAALRVHFPGNKYIQAGLTGHRDGVGFGVAGGQFAVAGLGYQLRYDYQQRASYSQALRGLNGRQNKVAGSVQAELGGGVSLDASLAWRQVTVDHESIGSGAALELSLLKTLLKETASAPGISLAYLGEISHFNCEHDIEVRRAIGIGADDSYHRLDELVDPRINRQELQLSVVRHWTERFQTTITGAVGYEFEDEQSVWRIGFQTAYRIRPNLRLTLEGDYDSSGQGPNAGSAMKSIWLGVAMDY